MKLTAFLFIVALGGARFAMAQPVSEFVFIAHPEVAVNSISREEAKNILLGNKTKWDGGGVINLVFAPNAPAHAKAVADLTARTPDQFEKHWKRQVFTGKGVLPEMAADDVTVVAYVAKTPGAIGWVGSGTKVEGVKLLKLD